MPTWLAIVLIAVLVLLVVLAVGGAVAQRRRMKATEGEFARQLEQANRDLAAAHAADRGWEPARLEAAAREAFAHERDGAAPSELALVQVIDRPGTDEDQAVFRAVDAAGQEHAITLGRRGDEWVLETEERG